MATSLWLTLTQCATQNVRLRSFTDSVKSFIKLTRTTILNYSKTTNHVWDKLLHLQTDDRHPKSVLMKASDVKPKRR